MDDPRICMVGAGNLSTRRIYPYIGLTGSNLVGICDIDPEKAQRNATRFGGTAYNDLETMLDKEKPDGVIICIGPKQHAQLAPIVMRRGIPVYTEKPPALNSDDAFEVAKIAKETGILCTTAFKKRYTTASSRAKEWIDSFDPNDLYSISIDYASSQYPNTQESNSFLLDFAVHIIDLVAYLFGDVTDVFSFAKGMDAYAVSLKFANGAVGSLNLNDGRSFVIPTEEVEISAQGANFMTIHNSSSWKITEKGKCTEWREPPTFASSGDSGNDTGHLAELQDFVDAIKEGNRSTRSNIYESYKSMLLYEAIKESAEKEEIVKLNYKTL